MDMSPIDKPPLTEETLAHYGIKGMKWGVRNEDKSGSSSSSSKDDDALAEINALSGGTPSSKRAPKIEEKPSSTKAKPSSKDDDVLAEIDRLSADDKEILKKAGVSPSDSASIKSKYGPGSLGDEPPDQGRLTPQQKEALKNAAIVVGVAGAIYLMYRQGNKMAIAADPVLGGAKYQDLPAFKKEWLQYQRTAGAKQAGYSKKMVESLSTEATHLKAGDIVRRISTEKESQIRPGGFFASPDASDVDRYKAILPVFWKQWGLAKDEGYVVHLKAVGDVKAPSPRHTFDMFKSMLDEEVTTQWGAKAKMRDLFPAYGVSNDDAHARKVFPQFAAAWNDDKHPGTKRFVEKLKEQGYNALIDMNDAGALSKKPMKFLDGSLFEIAGHEPLTRDAIRLAQENIKAIVHSLLKLLNLSTTPRLGGTVFDDEKPSIDELMHYGVMGMKWGKSRKQATGSDIRSARLRLQVKGDRYRQAKKATKKISDPEKKALAKEKVSKMKTEFLKDPDRVVASRLTQGEKAIQVLLGGPFGVAAIAGTSAASRRIEKKQEDGAYDK